MSYPNAWLNGFSDSAVRALIDMKNFLYWLSRRVFCTCGQILYSVTTRLPPLTLTIQLPWITLTLQRDGQVRRITVDLPPV